ncbi:MAG: CPBP family intramembrane glutamic endopeptidase [Candidatus Asgardarchaeia archaeon]
MTKKQKDIILTSIGFVFLAWLSISTIVNLIPMAFNFNENFDSIANEMNFLMAGVGKFLLIGAIFIIVQKIEKNDIRSLGLTRLSLKETAIHSLVLYVSITGVFMILFFVATHLGFVPGSGFYQLHDLIRSYAFWFFILSSATLEEILFRGFLIQRFADLVDNDLLSVLLISAFYGFLHLSLWGISGAVAFGFWGLLIGLYFVYVKRNLYPLMIAHFLSDLTIFVMLA